jgi:hypothetical protein
MAIYSALILLISVSSQEKYVQIGVHKMVSVLGVFVIVCQDFMEQIVQ